MKLAPACLMLVGCSSSPEFGGVYEVTEYTLERDVPCTTRAETEAPAPYLFFSFVTDDVHQDELTIVQCASADQCNEISADPSWYKIEDDQLVWQAPYARLVVPPTGPAECHLEWYREVVTLDDSTLVSVQSLRVKLGDPAMCETEAAKASATLDDCAVVDRMVATKL